MAEKEDTADTSGTRQDGRLLVALSRTMGIAARTVTHGLQELTAAVQPRRTAPKSRKAGNLTLLLQRLGQIVAEQKEDDYQALDGNKEFWELIQKLQAARRTQSIERTVKEKTIASRPRKTRGKKMKKNSSAASTGDAAESGESKPTPAADSSTDAQAAADGDTGAEVVKAEAEGAKAEAEVVKAEAEGAKAEAEGAKAKGAKAKAKGAKAKAKAEANDDEAKAEEEQAEAEEEAAETEEKEAE